MFENITLNAFAWGALSAISLPLGALLGLLWKPKQKINSAFMAFGAGALLFALTIELFGHVPHHVEEHGMLALVVALGGALLGGLFFDLLNNILNNRGAFLRRFSNARRYIARLKFKRAQSLLKELSKVRVLNDVPPENMATLVNFVKKYNYSDGDVVFKQNEAADSMYFITGGNVDIILHENAETKSIATLSKNDTFGEMGLVTNNPRTADAIARGNLSVYKINSTDFYHMINDLPELKTKLQELTVERLSDLASKSSESENTDWYNKTLYQLNKLSVQVSNEDIVEEGKKLSSTHAGGAAMAIWLGILIDGIPESLIIGMLAINPAGMSMAFVSGVFLANMPEAMSSAVSMDRGGMSKKKILLMWSSLTLLTGLGAALGAVIFPANPVGSMFYLVLGIEGLAAGAMLTMIAETMLPEAFEQGGSIVGISTLLGFLAALIVKVL